MFKYLIFILFFNMDERPRCIVEDRRPLKWYNSRFFSNIGEGLGIMAILFGVGYCSMVCGGPSEGQIEMERVRRGSVLQGADLNGNGIPDRFYVVNGKIAVVEMDGKPVAKSLDLGIEK
jgi:hypothetical protein